jgi:hypothetical protein
MVIITTLVAKVYFPASLERGSIPNIRRKYAYRRRPTLEEEEEHSEDDDDELEALYSDDEDENDNAEEEAENRALEYEQDEEPLVADLTGSPGKCTHDRSAIECTHDRSAILCPDRSTHGEFHYASSTKIGQEESNYGCVDRKDRQRYHHHRY